MANVYDTGDLVRITGTFTVSSTNTDPTTVTLKVKNPAGTTTTYTYALGEVTKSATGIYYKDVTVSSAGIWHYRWEGTGTVVSADEDWFEVKVSLF